MTPKPRGEAADARLMGGSIVGGRLAPGAGYPEVSVAEALDLSLRMAGPWRLGGPMAPSPGFQTSLARRGAVPPAGPRSRSVPVATREDAGGDPQTPPAVPGPEPRSPGAYKGRRGRQAPAPTTDSDAEPCTHAPSETMLFLLALSLLGSAAGFLSNYYGRMCAPHFCIYSHDGDDLTGLRVYEQSDHMIGIQAKFGDCWSPLHGRTGRGMVNELVLRPGERITSIMGSILGNIRSILVDTQERQHLFGTMKGQEFLVNPYHRGDVLKGICGLRDSIFIRSLAFYWGEFKENSTTVNC
ncbi:pancreatic adenocarcinoma up-regulated factor-like [Dipodomys merriami]|uniref:pancreatic adenocarcinoma up-regulated factor-like n=1 Tax=Dipodomys merriami TaxID=94247 RepID=UPI003855D767